jgi:hypothetical protein
VKKSSGKANRCLTLQFNAVALRPIYCRAALSLFKDALNQFVLVTSADRFVGTTNEALVVSRGRRAMTP